MDDKFGGRPPITNRPDVDNTLPSELEGLTAEEVEECGTTLKAILVAVREGLQAAKAEDGKLTCEEAGKVIGAALPAVGRLADELLADIKD